MARALRWGIAGCGKISWDYVTGFSVLPKSEHRVVACAARDATRAEKFAKDLEIPKVYKSYQEMAADPDIDIVYIGTIHMMHCELSCLYMNAGKHVLCEKPLAMNVKQVERCIEASKKNNVFLMEGVWTRHFPVYQRLREELKKGTIGEVRHVSASFGFNDVVDAPNLANKDIGGGVLMDMGPYPVQFALHVYGEEPEKIEATGKINKNGVDCFENITLKFSGNRTAELTLHGYVQLKNNSVLFGTEGMIEIPDMLWCPTEIVVKGEKFEYPLPGDKETLARGNYWHNTGFAYEAEAARDCILKGLKEHPLMSNEESLRSARVLQRIREILGIKFSFDE